MRKITRIFVFITESFLIEISAVRHHKSETYRIKAFFVSITKRSANIINVITGKKKNEKERKK